MRRHSALASRERCDGHAGKTRRGCGSLSFSGRLPGLPHKILSAVGLGFLPLMVFPIPVRVLVLRC